MSLDRPIVGAQAAAAVLEPTSAGAACPHQQMLVGSRSASGVGLRVITHSSSRSGTGVGSQSSGGSRVWAVRLLQHH
jgi:hypothetical protein